MQSVTEGAPPAVMAVLPQGSVAYEILHLSVITFFLGALHIGTLWYGISYSDPLRVLILSLSFAVINVIAAILAIIGYSRIPTRGLVKDSGHALMIALVCAALANSSDVILWQVFEVPLKSSMIPNLFFVLALGFGIFGILRLARLTSVEPGGLSIKAFIGLIGFYFLFGLTMSHEALSRPTFGGANEKEILFGLVYALVIAYMGAMCWEIYCSAQGRMRLAARTISIGTILLGFGCFIYGSLFFRQDSMTVSASTLYIILAIAYFSIGLGILRMGNTVLDMFQPDLDEIGPKQPLIDIFGVSIGTKVHEMLEQRIRRSEAARLAAEADSKTKSKFLAMMSHELRTPLTTVIAYAQLIADDDGPIGKEAPAHFREFGRRITSSANHLLGLIDGVLNFSKLDSGEGLGACETFDVDELVDFVRVVAEALAARNSLEFVVHVSTPPFRLEGHQHALRQILSNLVVNAFKFTTEGRVTMALEACGADLVCRISDTGIGIESHELEKIFEPFYQISAGNSRKYGGTGLGLSIIKRLLEAMRGTIRLESEKGRGTTVTVTVPGIIREGTT